MARSSFKFRLNRLLDVRVMREKQAQQELQQRRAMVAQEQEKLAVLLLQEDQLRADQAAPFERGKSLDEFHMKRVWLEGEIKKKQSEQEAQRDELAKAEAAVLIQQEVVKQRGIDVKALEKLQEKQREEHRLEQLREEGLFMDDLAGQGFIRRARLKEQLDSEEGVR